MQHNGKEIRIVHLPFPKAIRGSTLESPDDYLVAINQNLPGITERHTIGHELAHIFLDHFDDSCMSPYDDEETIDRKLHSAAAREKERQANKAAWEYYRAYRDNRL